jgi:hypothetical protein
MAVMNGLSGQQMNLCVRAFERAWLSLLRAKRVQEANIKKLPTLLMAAVLEEAANGKLKQAALVKTALKRVQDFKEEIKE